ncbi:hypothetical protein [Schleiferilactobacillus shenzhenensis]|uniref:Uncharacterized protein n=1 Tax=Schleiferilactobacillus shenzhenensis LY-73 TaxID=1231336 RepID=U4TH45_9LACO|nr:hypothetical protein [Schleiferilactobacillus shenzhenensis]ERL64121.1 hypothetical protein L248_1563 [Schleiferilactobacillus shenzhenensis LY-73]
MNHWGRRVLRILLSWLIIAGVMMGGAFVIDRYFSAIVTPDAANWLLLALGLAAFGIDYCLFYRNAAGLFWGPEPPLNPRLRQYQAARKRGGEQ